MLLIVYVGCLFCIIIIINRMEKLELRNSSTQAKIIGTVALVSGAIVMVLYKGPIILSPPSTQMSSQFLRLTPPTNSNNWVLGGFLLVVSTFLNALTFILQVTILFFVIANILVNGNAFMKQMNFFY